MKNSFKILVTFLGLALLFTACTPAENELGPLMAKSALKFSITPSATDSNLIILKSLTPGVTPEWVTPLGRSTRVQDSVKIAFPGTYKFIYGVESAGGIVQADTFTLVIKTTNLTYVNDPKWTLLCGGVGNAKTWVLDIDAKAETKYWPGPIGYQNDLTVAPWTYFPTYKGNEWLCPAIDYGTMTFNLQGGPNVIVNQLGPAAATLTGTYFLDVTAQPFPTVSFSNVVPLNPNYNASEIWSTGHILFLSDNALEIGFEAIGKAEWDVFCYISKAYSDSWVPSNPVDPNFNFGTTPTQKDILSAGTKTWKLDLQVPYNWANLDGSLIQPWVTRADIEAMGWAAYGEADVAGIQNAALTFTPNGTVIQQQNNGTLAFGTFTVDEPTNRIIFTNITPNILIAGTIIVAPSADNSLKILKIEKTGDVITGIWLGQRETKAEYVAFHFVIR